MNIRRPWLALALLFSVVVVIGVAIPSSLAYIAAQSNTIVNSFTATYIPPEPASVEIHVHKTVHNIGTESIGPEGFRFQLQNTQNSESFTLTTGTNGFASAFLPFSDADLGKNHTYRLYEINDGCENVTYSEKVYTIEITLSVNADNQIVAAASVDGQPVQQIAAVFENEYNAGIIVPPTGDDTPIALYMVLMLISSAGLVLLFAKRKSQVLK